MEIGKLKVNPSLQEMSGLGNYSWPCVWSDKRLEGSIRRQGIKNPIIVDSDCVIIDGYRRYAIALRLGLKNMKVIQI